MLCIDSQYSSQQLTIIWSLKHHSTQPIHIFNRENPKNSESPKDQRRKLDFIALIETTCSTLKLWYTLLFLSAFKMYPPPCDLVFVKLKIFGWGAFLFHLLHLVTVTFAKKSLLGKQNYLTKISLAQTIA